MLSQSDLAALLEAASAKLPACNCSEPYHQLRCARVIVGAAIPKARCELRDLAPALAQEVLDQREAGQALAEALRRTAPKWAFEDHERPHPGECDMCLELDALARWAEMAETEVQDAK